MRSCYSVIICRFWNSCSRLLQRFCAGDVAACFHLAAESLITPDVCISADEPIAQLLLQTKNQLLEGGGAGQVVGSRLLSRRRDTCPGIPGSDRGTIQASWALPAFAHYVMTAGSAVLLTRLSIGTSVVDGVMEPRWNWACAGPLRRIGSWLSNRAFLGNGVI